MEHDNTIELSVPEKKKGSAIFLLLSPCQWIKDIYQNVTNSNVFRNRRNKSNVAYIDQQREFFLS